MKQVFIPDEQVEYRHRTDRFQGKRMLTVKAFWIAGDGTVYSASAPAVEVGEDMTMQSVVKHYPDAKRELERHVASVLASAETIKQALDAPREPTAEERS